MMKSVLTEAQVYERQPGSTAQKKEAKMTIRHAWVLSIVLACLSTGSASAADNVKAIFKDGKGKQIGTATLIATPTGLLIEAELTGLPPGEHAFHIHQTGRCDAADGFKSAGPHYSSGKREHGYKVEGGPHTGDMPNQFVNADGTLHTHLFSPNVVLNQGDGALFDSDGSALIVHAKADDYQSQPAGDAGDRIACAVIERAG
jgi:Cu-Zn family superoxide dismutase